jgi:hypothetical protein
MADTKHSEGLKLARLFMVLSGMSPLFILWAINSLLKKARSTATLI